MFCQLGLISSSRHQNVTKISLRGVFFLFCCGPNYMYNMQHTGRGQSYICHKNPTGLSMWGGGFRGGGHSLLNFDDT